MAKLKCLECGQVFNEQLGECPNCGCPANECNADIEISDGENRSTEKRKASPQNEKRTTDTGYLNESAVAGYADIVFACATIGCLAIYIAIIIMVARISDSTEATIYIAFFGLIVTTIYIVVFYIAKAFIKIYANISINLHEINMKLK